MKKKLFLFIIPILFLIPSHVHAADTFSYSDATCVFYTDNLGTTPAADQSVWMVKPNAYTPMTLPNANYGSSSYIRYGVNLASGEVFGDFKANNTYTFKYQIYFEGGVYLNFNKLSHNFNATGRANGQDNAGVIGAKAIRATYSGNYMWLYVDLTPSQDTDLLKWNTGGSARTSSQLELLYNTLDTNSRIFRVEYLQVFVEYSQSTYVKEQTDEIKRQTEKQTQNHYEAQQTRYSIIDTIKNVLSGILELPKKIGEVFIDAFKSLFITKDDFFSDYFDSLYKFFTDKLGIIAYPLELLLDLLDRFLNMSNSSNGIINIPNIDVGPFGRLISARTWNISEYWSQAPYKQIYDVYLVFIHCFIGLGLVNLAKKKYSEIVGGGVGE